MEASRYNNSSLGIHYEHMALHWDRKDFNNWKQTKVLDLAPVIVLDVLFMLFGVVGNSIVCYVCYFRLPRNVINSFVMALALIELLGCVLTIPVDITEIINVYSFGFPALCKAERYLTKFVVFSSGCVLIAIARERYQRIVNPYSRHVTMSEFKRAMIGSLVVSAVVAVPEAVLAGSETVLTPYGKGVVCSTYTSDIYRNTLLPKLWGLTCVLIYVACTTSIGAIYFAIAAKIWKRGKVKTDQRSKSLTPDSTLQRRIRPEQINAWNKTHQTASNIYINYVPKSPAKTAKSKQDSLKSAFLYNDVIRHSPLDATNKVSKSETPTILQVTDVHGELCCTPTSDDSKPFKDEDLTYRFSVVVESSGEKTSTLGHYQRRKRRQSEGRHQSKSGLVLEELMRSLSLRVQHRRHDQQPAQQDRLETLQPLTPMGSLRRRPAGYSRKRTTFIMFVMTLTTVLSHLPHISVMLYKLTHPSVDINLQSDLSVLFKIMWNSYFISLATHPFVYGFWNGRFKHALFSLFTGISRRRLRTREQRESYSSNRPS